MTIKQLSVLLFAFALVCYGSAHTVSVVLKCVSAGSLKLEITPTGSAATSISAFLQSGQFIGNLNTAPGGITSTLTAPFVPTTLATIGPAIVTGTQDNTPFTIITNIANCPVVAPKKPNPQITFTFQCGVPTSKIPGQVCVTVTATNTGNVPFTSFSLVTSGIVSPATVAVLPVGSSTSITPCFTPGTTSPTFTFDVTAVGTSASGVSTTFTAQKTCPNPFFVSTPPGTLTVSEVCNIFSVDKKNLKDISFRITITNTGGTPFTQVFVTKKIDPSNPSAALNYLVASIPAFATTTITGNYKSPSNQNTVSLVAVDSTGATRSFGPFTTTCTPVVKAG